MSTTTTNGAAASDEAVITFPDFELQVLAEHWENLAKAYVGAATPEASMLKLEYEARGKALRDAIKAYDQTRMRAMLAELERDQLIDKLKRRGLTHVLYGSSGLS